MKLSDMQPGEVGTVQFIWGGTKVTGQLGELGIEPDCKLSVTAKAGGHVIVGLGHRRFALSDDVASKIIL